MPVIPGLPLLDVVAVAWFFVCWLGYTYWADHQSGRSLASIMKTYRRFWARCMLERDNRMVDVMIFGHLMSSVSFFASTSLAVIGGLLAVLGARVQAMNLLRELPLVSEGSALLWDLKVLLLVVIFIYAFFKYMWAYRHYNYCLILLGAVTNPGQVAPRDLDIADRMAAVATATGKHFNRGLRAYYFGLGALSWFLHPLLFMAVSVWVVLVLHRREFRSRLMDTLGDPDTALLPEPVQKD